MTHPVKLTDLIEGLEFQSDEGRSYLNTATGEVVYITNELRAAEEEQPLEDFPAWQQDALRIARACWKRSTISLYPTDLTSMNTISWSVSALR
jgi:hypothetical protein